MGLPNPVVYDTDEILPQWLSELGQSIRKIDDSWAVEMSHKYVRYWITIVEHGDWTSLGAVLFGAASGQHSKDFYQFALTTNASITAARIAFEDGRLVLVSNFPTEDCGRYEFFRNLYLFHKTHEVVYGDLLEAAEKLNVILEPYDE